MTREGAMRVLVLVLVLVAGCCSLFPSSPPPSPPLPPPPPPPPPPLIGHHLLCWEGGSGCYVAPTDSYISFPPMCIHRILVSPPNDTDRHVQQSAAT